MKRRRLLQMASAGVAGTLAGCTDSLGVLGSGEGEGDCELADVDGLSQIWSHASGGRAAPHVTGEFEVEDELETEWTGEKHSSVRVRFASAETLYCRVTDEDEGRVEGFYDTESGDLQWELRTAPDPEDTEFEPPDETVVYDEVSLAPQVVADGTVYATASYTGADATISTAVFALDAADGSIEWSKTVPGGDFLSIDAAGRLYAVGVSDALARADPDDRELDGGEWTPEPRTDERLHVHALDAAGGDTCWEQSVEVPEGATGGSRPVVTGGHVVVSVEWGDRDQPDEQETELYAFDAATGDETASVSHAGRPFQEGVLGAGEQLFYRTETPPTEDAPTDGPTLCAVDLDAEEFDWQIEPPGLLCAATDEVVVVQSAEAVMGLDPASGEQEWSTEYEDPIADGDLADTLWGTPDGVACVAGDALVTTAGDGTEIQTRALDSGEVIARTPVGGTITTGEVVPADGRFYAARYVEGDDEGEAVVAFE